MAAPTITATVGSATANSYCTKAEADTYFNERLPLNPPWEDAESPEAALIMAARIIDMVMQPQKTLVRGKPSYYVTRRTWTGLPATTTQKLAWPRTLMFDRNGNAILATVVPQELKDAQAELAGQLLLGDRTLDNDVVVQGLTSLKAGSVSLSFKDGILPQVLPDAVLNLMPPSWFTDEIVTSAMSAQFEVI